MTDPATIGPATIGPATTDRTVRALLGDAWEGHEGPLTREDLTRIAEVVVQAISPDPANEPASATGTASAEVSTPDVKPDRELWLDGFSCIRPTGEFATAVGRDVLRLCRVPGKTLIEVTIS
ncbi:hypothetical protein GCG21_08795 [Pseudactinotalea sp. HY160]|uniref:hypothetical protein n=1 Tax=Pseudactinotalea sp. HY160 TaxID=2654490 RepID=UPI00128B1E31|nr:hypothetical protein [Pseudactinotalea sp. HY160]MPV50102.1 hypothetical protein [Pseudactinotalea sp. HY160]